MVTWVQNIVLFQQIYRTCNNLKGQPSGAWVHEKVISKQVHLNILSICYNKKLLNTSIKSAYQGFSASNRKCGPKSCCEKPFWQYLVRERRRSGHKAGHLPWLSARPFLRFSWVGNHRQSEYRHHNRHWMAAG